MYKYLTPGLWFCLLALCVAFFPHFFILRKYEKKFEDFFSEKFRLFHFFQLGWMVISACVYVLMVAFFAADNRSYELAALSMFFASVALPPALFSALTGVYPEISRKGYHYYERHSNSSEQAPTLANHPHLKTMGWIQFVFLAVVISVSAVCILW